DPRLLFERDRPAQSVRADHVGELAGARVERQAVGEGHAAAGAVELQRAGAGDVDRAGAQRAGRGDGERAGIDRRRAGVRARGVELHRTRVGLGEAVAGDRDVYDEVVVVARRGDVERDRGGGGEVQAAAGGAGDRRGGVIVAEDRHGRYRR